ncbi:MAG: membrane dipeptidase [Clostridia bacterium]|nr:membrane dipeptidase [Clostridia bacterium]
MLIADSHCDSILKVAQGKCGLVNQYNFSQKQPQLQFVALFTGRPSDTPESAWSDLVRYSDSFSASLTRECERISQVRTYADIEQALAKGKHAALLSLESATALDGSCERLQKLWELGVRVVGLTWLSNSLAKSNRVLDDGEIDTGLSALGKELVCFGNRLGIIWDVSHASDKTFWDLAELSKKPIIASHSNFRSVCPHSRNLTDSMARHIISSGGIIGLNLCPPFVHSEEQKRTVDSLFLHIDHCLELGGESTLGFGCDIDGIASLPSPLSSERSIHDQLIELMQKHYPERTVEKIAGENYMSFLKKWL